jgi:hypothetical protein
MESGDANTLHNSVPLNLDMPKIEVEIKATKGNRYYYRHREEILALRLEKRMEDPEYAEKKRIRDEKREEREKKESERRALRDKRDEEKRIKEEERERIRKIKEALLESCATQPPVKPKALNLENNSTSA